MTIKLHIGDTLNIPEWGKLNVLPVGREDEGLLAWPEKVHIQPGQVCPACFRCHRSVKVVRIWRYLGEACEAVKSVVVTAENIDDLCKEHGG